LLTLILSIWICSRSTDRTVSDKQFVLCKHEKYLVIQETFYDSRLRDAAKALTVCVAWYEVTDTMDDSMYNERRIGWNVVTDLSTVKERTVIRSLIPYRRTSETLPIICYHDIRNSQSLFPYLIKKNLSICGMN
jgi:hypothetical protein